LTDSTRGALVPNIEVLVVRRDRGWIGKRFGHDRTEGVQLSVDANRPGVEGVVTSARHINKLAVRSDNDLIGVG